MIDTVAAISERWREETKEESQASLSTVGGFAVTAYQQGKEQHLFYGCGEARLGERCYVSNADGLLEVKALLNEGLLRLKSL
jgi:hypothetical protein